MLIDEHMQGAIEAVYDAAVDETLWPAALRKLTDATGSQAATFWVLDGSETPRLPLFNYVNLDAGFIDDYLANVAPLDPTVQYLVSHPDAPIVHDGMVISERQKDRHAYYDWHDSYCDLRFRMVGQVCPAPDVHAGVALLRGRTVGRYEQQDIETFRLLYRHLARALTIALRLGTQGAMQQATAEILDHSPAAFLLLDKHKRVIYANRSADNILAQADGIRRAGNGMLAVQQHNDTLQHMIVQAFAPRTSALGPAQNAPGGVLRIPRPSGRRPYLIAVAPVSREYPALTLSRPAVCITITDPEHMLPPYHRLRAAFGLTDAETRLAHLLLEGEELRAVAAKLGITYGTARARLSAIFQKTNTRRQGELISLLLTTLAMA